MNSCFYAWVNQEMLKGSWLAGVVANREAGWGCNSFYSNLTTNQANALPPDQLRTNSFFRHFVETTLYSVTDGSAKAANPIVREKVLADGIPALSNAAGGPDGGSLGSFQDMSGMKWLNEDGLWPRQNNCWLHSDIKNIAYPFNYVVFDQIVSEGGL